MIMRRHLIPTDEVPCEDESAMSYLDDEADPAPVEFALEADPADVFDQQRAVDDGFEQITNEYDRP